MLRFLPLAAALALFLAHPAAAMLPIMHGEPAVLPKAAAAPKLRLAPARAAGARVELTDVAAEALERVRAENLASPRRKVPAQPRRVVIGVVRATDGEMGAPPASDLAWNVVEGGFAAQVTVLSPRAESLRLAVSVMGVPKDVEMIFFGSGNPARLEGPVSVGDIRDRTAPWWTPVTEGEAQTIELFVPARHEPKRLAVRVVRASHLLTTPSSNFHEVAPYRTPAQMQAVADSLATLWGFEAAACGASTPRSTWTQRYGGATYLYNDPQSDALLLRLNDAPPADAFFSGWDPNPVQGGASVVTIHHPQGDLKKVTQGAVLGYSSPGVAGGSQAFIETQWSRGTTEGGSSGSGLWTSNGSQWLFRGALWGGSALCTNMTGSDFYSRFDVVFAAISRHLGASGGGATDYTDLWWNPAESGWGLNLIQHPSRIIFGVWYTYSADGKRTWFVMPDGTWTSSNTYSGPLYSTAGPSLAQSFDASKVRVSPVGEATLTFSDADNGSFAFSVNGVSGSKRITRQPF